MDVRQWLREKRGVALGKNKKMEDWQREHITSNLHELASNTMFHGQIQAQLRAKNVLGKADIEKLNAQINQNGNFHASYQCYEWLMGRTNAYKVLTQALIQSRQTGAARILIDGVPTELFSKPFTYLGISTKIKRFEDAEMEVNGKTFNVHQFFPGVNYQTLQQIFQETVPELEIYETFVMKQRTFVLAKNTVPPKPPVYLPRFLSNRIIVDESTFKEICRDVFVFKNTIQRHKLTQIVNSNFTDTSASQLNKITCRFIYLDHNKDWIELKKKCVQVPIHLINYEADGNVFLLEDSSAPSAFLKKLGSGKERIYMSEEEFVQQQLSEKCTSSRICICDNPGMGKTLLLANVARGLTERCTRRIIVFIQLTSYAKEFCPGVLKNITEHEELLLNALSYVTSSDQIPELLMKLIQAKLIQLDLFFDGFDELPQDEVDWIKHVFRSITTSLPNVRIYIASRPHMRQELETGLEVVAYDILPFNQQNQVNFLVQFWQNRKPDINQLSLQNYASSCLEAVNKSLTKMGQQIAGIPLLCHLIAEIYSDHLEVYLIKRRNFSDMSLKISGMYQEFIRKKISIVAKNQIEFENIKLVQIWHALKLLFPTSGYHKTNQFKYINDLLISPEILKVGILQKQTDGAMEFIHRTFAEYLVAEYFSTKLRDTEIQKSEEGNCNSISILRLLLDVQKRYPENEFVHPVIVSFFNFAFGEVIDISEELKSQGASLVTSMSHADLISMLSACCKYSQLNIFSFLMEALTECNKSWIAECFTDWNCYQLLSVCICESTSQMFHSCIRLLTEVLKLDVARIDTSDISVFVKETLMQSAVGCSNYEAVEYFADRVSLKNQNLLAMCTVNSFCIDTSKNILYLLLNKDPTLVYETTDILLNYFSEVRLFKILVEYGVNLTHVTETKENCVMCAAEYMSPSDYHDLVQFLIADCKAEYLFRENEKWTVPLPYIIYKVTLLPETLELLLNIPSMDINMNDKNGENLLFAAVKGNKVDNVKQLVKSGVDYIERGGRNRSLLHLAAKHGKDEMVRYLFSLKLDPNSRDEDGSTPLHYAASVFYERLSVVEILVENGANVKAKNKYGQNALHLSAAYGDSKSVEIIRYLIRKGAEVHDRDNEGNSPLHLSEWNWQLTDCLIEMGANVIAKNKVGHTPT